MYISKMSLLNFKCFEGEHEFSFNSGVNYFVGDNNSGKTTIFKAIEFIKSSKTKEGWITKGREKQDVMVEITIEGEDLKEYLEKDELKKYSPYLIDESKIKLRRSSKETTWYDSKGKSKEISIKNIAIYNPNTDLFENPAGVDSVISVLFDAQFVYSDLRNDEFQNFGKSTTIVGKLINTITKNFQNTEKWRDFKIAHAEAFGDTGLVGVLNNLQREVEKIMADQYGNTKVEFSFGIPTIDNFFKTGQILLEDNGIKTDASEKGTGMQRALALTLIQVYSQIYNMDNEEVSKPIFFFIDEPETFLHPIAQNKLIESLNRISQNNQVFITTHSPYLLKSFKKNNKISIFSRDGGAPSVVEDISLNMFPHSPTWGEINYKAFKIGSTEFHIELFGLLHKKASDARKTYNNGNNTVSFNKISSFDKWLIEQNPTFSTDNMYQNIHNGYTDQSMTTYIRNYFDHPGEDKGLPTGQYRTHPTIEDIENSINSMMEILKKNFN